MIKFAAVGLALMLSACGTPGQVVIGTPTIVAAEKSLTLAHLAYDGVGASLKTAADSGVLKGPAAATAKCWYDRAGDALNTADAADKAANAGSILSAVTAAQDAIVQTRTPTATCSQ